MNEIQLKATVAETTDLGEFTAIAAAYSVDRQDERIRPGAFAATIERWRGSGKDLPLHWDHRSGAEFIIGSVDPTSMRETDEGLYVEGTLDIHDSDLARQAWRSVKKNRIGLSFGYLITDERVGGDGVKELLGLDVFEITLTATPANPDARVLSAKSAGEQDLRTAAREHMLAVLTGPEPVPTLDELRARTKALRVDELARKAQPIQIVTFEC